MTNKLGLLTVVLASLATAACSGAGAVDDESAVTTSGLNNSGVDTSLLVPPLSTNVDWRCARTGETITCQGQVEREIVPWEPFGEEFNCDGVPVYRTLVQDGQGIREYNSDNKLIHRHVHWHSEDIYGLDPAGPGESTASGKADWTEDFVLATPGVPSSATMTIKGTEAIAQDDDPGNEIAYIDKGELVAYPDGNFTIVRGRFDLWTDFEGSVASLCRVLTN